MPPFTRQFYNRHQSTKAFEGGESAGPGKGQLAIVHDALQKFWRQFG